MKISNRFKVTRSTARPENLAKPRLLFFRTVEPQPEFIQAHLDLHVRCLSTWFDVTLISGDCDYAAACERHEPELCLFESGVYRCASKIANTSAHPSIPKIGLLNSDAYCATRSLFLSDMERYGVETFFSVSVSMPEYLSTIADRLFVWPNFVDGDVFRDYGESKHVTALITGSHASHYPFRNKINQIIAERFPTIRSPHFGWTKNKATSKMPSGEPYARLINRARFAATCGTIANDIVRKHFEIPACKTCLITERTPAVVAAGFSDMENCVFVTPDDVVDKIEFLIENPDRLEVISCAGHDLVHARHTTKKRDQIFSWFKLHNELKPGQRIVQPGPFSPLAALDEKSESRPVVWTSGSVDRALLHDASLDFRHRNYAAAEQKYLQCLNYHFMPEPLLGLALCSLRRGDARTAARWISRSVRSVSPADPSYEPDPVEWAWYVISILCTGRLSWAAKLAARFPKLDHTELERCRYVISVLSGTPCETTVHNFRILNSSEGRPSMHRGVEIGLDDWIEDLCSILTGCCQYQFVDVLRKYTDKPSVARSKSRVEIRKRRRIFVELMQAAGLRIDYLEAQWILSRRLPKLARKMIKYAKAYAANFRRD